MKKRAYVETYGCQMNISDGELMSGILAAAGYELVERPEEADVVLVNTCAIRDHAERRVLGRVAQLNALRAANPDLMLGVTGCMAQRMGEELFEKAPYVELVMGPDGYRDLPAALRRLRNGDGGLGGGSGREEAAAEEGVVEDLATAVAAEEAGEGGAKEETAEGTREGGAAGQHGSPLVQLRVGSGGRRRGLAVLDLRPEEDYEGLESRRRSAVSAWVPIQRGCDHRCTFCIVPYVRGPEKNRSPEAVLAEVRQVAAEGITEVMLLGQTVNSYRWGDWDFPRLLRAVARVEGVRRVRFVSPHPNDVTPAMVEAMAEEEAVCEQLHLPLQAGNDRTLKRMLRRHTVAQFLEKVALLRSAMPGIALSTDVIVGFPGETRSEFEDTLAVLEEVRFDDAFTYRFSPREGTPATRLPRETWVAEEEAQRRLEELISLTRRIQAEINAAEVGRVEEVLVEGEGREAGYLLGKTRRNKVVVFPGEASLIGSYCAVQLTRTTGATFVGALADPVLTAGAAR